MMRKNIVTKQEPIKKQELRHLLSNNNWYRMAVEKQPYMLVEIIRGLESPVEQLKDKRVYATSSSQARFLFFKIYPWLKQYNQDKKEIFGDIFGIEARFDVELYRQKKQQQKTYKQKEEEQIQNAWWNQ